MQDRSRRSPHIGVALLLIAVVALLAGRVSPVSAQDASVGQLRLDVQNLRYQFDLELRQLQSRIDLLQDRIRQLETARVGDGLVSRGNAAPPPTPERVDRGTERIASRFIVEDEQGRIRAVLGMSDVHGPMLALLDETGAIGSLTSIPENVER